MELSIGTKDSTEGTNFNGWNRIRQLQQVITNQQTKQQGSRLLCIYVGDRVFAKTGQEAVLSRYSVSQSTVGMSSQSIGKRDGRGCFLQPPPPSTLWQALTDRLSHLVSLHLVYMHKVTLWGLHELVCLFVTTDEP